MENFIPIYPSQDDPDIQRLLTAKKEFQNLRPEVTRYDPNDGRNLFNYQYMFEVFMTIMDRMLNIYATGAGKTCSFIAGCEKFKHKGGFRGCIIIEKSKTLINEIRKQIVNTCTPKEEYFIEESILEDSSERIRKKRLNESLKDWYTFETYESFSNSLEDLTEDQITAKYNRYIFVLDEAHNIISSKEGDQDFKQYTQYSRLCHNIPQSKIFLVSATPMINKPNEAIFLMNLLLPLDNQIPIKNNYRLSELEPYFRGKIAFIQSPLSDIKIEYPGSEFRFNEEIPDLDPLEPEKDSNLPVKVTIPINMYLTKMGDLQESHFRASPKDSFLTKEKSNSTLVFPIINDRETDSSDYITEKKNKLQWKSNPEFIDWTYRGDYISFKDWIYNGGDLSNLERISGKLAEIIRIERDSPGCSFMYNPLVANAGVKFITMVISLFGYEMFTENNADAIFLDTAKTQIRDSFKKKPRIAMISGGSSGADAHQALILNLFNSDANVNGEYIKILIGSRKTRDGINVYHCQRMHLFFPDWHYSGMIQAINRVLRVTGHNALKAQRRQEALALGLREGTPEYIEYTTIKVQVFRHCIDYNLDANVAGKSDNNSDFYFMKTAVEKEIQITLMLNMMKICAIDNMLNRSANRISLDNPFNFNKVRYLPSWTEITTPGYVPFETDPIDYSTYNILYSQPHKISNEIKKIIETNGSISYESIFDTFKDASRFEILEAIDYLRKEGRYLNNKLTLKISESGIHAQRFTTPADPRFIDNISIYDNPSVITSNRSLSSYLESNRIFMIRKLFTEFVSYENNFNDEVLAEKIAWLKSKDQWIQMQILEELVLHLIKRPSWEIDIDTAIIKGLLAIYKGYFFDFRNEDPPVFIHTMSTAVNKSTHNTLSKHKNPYQIKLLFPGETKLGWRLPIDKEESKYRDMYLEIVENELSKFEKYSRFGTILQDGKFRVIDIEPDMATKDKRMVHRGQDPGTKGKIYRVKLAVDERLPIRNKNISEKVRKESIKYLRESIKDRNSKKYVDSLTDDQVILYHEWDAFENLKYFQSELMNKLREDNRMYEPYILTY